MIEVEATVALLAAMSDRQHMAALTILVAELDRRAEEITELGNKFVVASRRIAELEAALEVRTEWGVRHVSDSAAENVQPCSYESAARTQCHRDRMQLVNRLAVGAITGPWIDA